MFKIFGSKVDRLSHQKKSLVLKRDKLDKDMKERNANRGNKIQALENAAATDYEETQKKIVELNRKIDKKIREIQSEQTYVQEVAQSETAEYLKEQKNILKAKETETVATTMKKETKEIKINKK